MGNKNLQPFEQIKKSDEELGEYWSARDLQKALGYSSWRSFSVLIDRAKKSFETSKITHNQNINYHFGQVDKMVQTGSGAERIIEDYMLSRYACYLIAQNGDPSKEPIALAQSYFNIQASGVEDYAEFNDAGYLGLYGMRNKDIVKKKNLGNDKLLDRAGSTELGGTMPEDLPPENEHIKKLEKRVHKTLAQKDNKRLSA